MEHYISLFVKAIFIENMALSFFLGMCTFLAVSKKVSTAFGLGVAVTFVLGLSVPANQLVYSLLKDGALVEGVGPDLPEIHHLHRRDCRFGADFGNVLGQIRPCPLQRIGYLPASDYRKLRDFRCRIVYGATRIQLR